MDDNNVSRIDPQVVTDVMVTLEKYFENFSITRGWKHNYLGMDIEIHENGMVDIAIIPQIKKK